MNVRTLVSSAALSLVILGGAAPALASGGDDFGRRVTLPSTSQLITIESAMNAILGAHPGTTVLRVQLELEHGVWVYRGEGVSPTSTRDGYRMDIDALTGQVRRDRTKKLGGGDRREAQAIVAQPAAITFVQAAAAGQTAAPGIVSDVRLRVEGRSLVYKVTTHTQTSRSEIRIDPATGTVLRVSTRGVPTVTPGGNNPGGNNPPGGSNPGGSNPGGSNPGGNPPAGTAPLTGQAAQIASGIEVAMIGQPAGAMPIEAKFKKVSVLRQIEVLVGVPGQGVGQEVKVNPVNGSASRESEDLGDDGTVLNAFAAALNGQTPIGFAAAMQNAVGLSGRTVTRAEIGVLGGRPIYEVKVISGLREVSVKVHALTGNILE